MSACSASQSSRRSASPPGNAATLTSLRFADVWDIPRVSAPWRLDLTSSRSTTDGSGTGLSLPHDFRVVAKGSEASPATSRPSKRTKDETSALGTTESSKACTPLPDGHELKLHSSILHQMGRF